MVNLKSTMSTFKYMVSAIIGASLLFLAGCGAVSDTQPQYVPAGVYDSDAGVAVASEQNTELADMGYLKDKFERSIEFHSVDYIHVTNGLRSKERKYMREGDSFLDLTLESIGWSNIATMDNEFSNHVSVVATFVGEITAQGDIRKEIRYDGELVEWILYVFTPQEAYLERFPWLINDSGDIVFHITNFNELNTGSENIYDYTLSINTLMIVRYYNNVFNYITIAP